MLLCLRSLVIGGVNMNLYVRCPNCKEVLLVEKHNNNTDLIFDNTFNLVQCTKCKTKTIVSVVVEKLKGEDKDE